ncbi:MAG: Rv0361 family membrane protein [Mycobacterium sp.]
MSNPQGPEQPDEVTDEVTEAGDDEAADGAEPATEVMASSEPEHEPVTEVISAEALSNETPEEPERRFTAPSGFDAGATTRINTPSEPATEVMAAAPTPVAKNVSPQVIPPRGDAPKSPATKRRSWGWVFALVLVIAALVAVAVLGTLLLTRDSEPSVSQEDRVRTTIEDYDAAIAKGDLATLRTITCGKARDDYVTYNDRVWSETHSRIAAAKRYPVIASIDQVVVNGDHAEANVTTFMAYAPQTRSTRSLDLEFRDDQWKICQAPAS